MGLRLKAGVMDGLLDKNGIGRAALAKELETGLAELDGVLDGKAEAGEELSRLLIAAFGAGALRRAVDWAATEAGGDGADCEGGL